ncbi:hypothetical protein MUK42_02676, partial [Musa troglodytarum]
AGFGGARDKFERGLPPQAVTIPIDVTRDDPPLLYKKPLVSARTVNRPLFGPFSSGLLGSLVVPTHPPFLSFWGGETNPEVCGI